MNPSHAAQDAPSGLPEVLALHCPTCARAQRPAPLMRAATLLCRRTCPGCRTRWVLKVTVMRVTALGAMHHLEWTVAA
jgi:hypothetical protein